MTGVLQSRGVARVLPALLLLAPRLAAAEVMHASSSSGDFHGGVSSNGPRNVEEMDTHSVLAALGLLSGSFMLIMLVLRLYLRCWRRPERVAKRRAVTAADVEERFPVRAAAPPGPAGEETCVICLCNIEADEGCRKTQCGHTFHADCIMQWWVHKPRKVLRCPMCRQRQRRNEEKKERRGKFKNPQAAQSPGGDLEAGLPEEDAEADAPGSEAPNAAADAESAEAPKEDAADSNAAPEQEYYTSRAGGHDDDDDDVVAVSI